MLAERNCDSMSDPDYTLKDNTKFRTVNIKHLCDKKAIMRLRFITGHPWKSLYCRKLLNF